MTSGSTEGKYNHGGEVIASTLDIAREKARANGEFTEEHYGNDIDGVVCFVGNNGKWMDVFAYGERA